jgi:hypothetical protein
MRAVSRLIASLRRAAGDVEDWFLGPADARAYACIRIGYAIAALSVLVDFWPLRSVLLSEDGLFGGAAPGSTLNLFAWARSQTAVDAVMLVAAASMVCLALGVAPRLAAAVTYVWVLSYSETAAVALSGFDTILRVVGFVLVVSPMPRTFCIGATKEAPAPPAYGLRLVQWQLMLIYVGTVWLKAPDEFWRRGEAVTYFMMSMFARFPNPGFSHRLVLGGILTYGTLLIEIGVPFLLWMRRTRWLGALLGLSLHLGIALSSKLALFSLTILPLYLAFFEKSDFDALASLFGREPRVEGSRE